MLADIADHAVAPAEPARRLIPSAAALAAMEPADRELERQIALARQRVYTARTSFCRRLTIGQLKLLEGRRTPAALRTIALHATALNRSPA